MSLDAMKQALEALEDNRPWQASTLLRLAIQQAERPYADKAALLNSDRLRIDPVTGNVGIGSVTQAERQEPVAWVGLEESDMPDGEDPVYDSPFFIKGMVWANNKLLEKNAAPPQRQPLTVEEIMGLYRLVKVSDLDGYSIHGRLEFARAIERAHGITGETQ